MDRVSLSRLTAEGPASANCLLCGQARVRVSVEQIKEGKRTHVAELCCPAAALGRHHER